MEPGGRVLKPYPLHQISIVGMGPSAVAFANSIYYEEVTRKKGYSEAWTLNYGQQVWQHDVLFNMRDLIHFKEHFPEADFIEAYREHPVPVVTARFIKEIKNCYEPDMESIFATFGDSYFSCGPAYMIAFAILCLEMQPEGKKELHIFGLDYNYHGKSDYEAGRANVEYWIGRAIERKINVKVPQSSALMDLYQRNHQNGCADNGRLYGYNGLTPQFDTECGTHLKLIGWKDRNEPE